MITRAYNSDLISRPRATPPDLPAGLLTTRSRARRNASSADNILTEFSGLHAEYQAEFARAVGQKNPSAETFLENKIAALQRLKPATSEAQSGFAGHILALAALAPRLAPEEQGALLLSLDHLSAAVLRQAGPAVGADVAKPTTLLSTVGRSLGKSLAQALDERFSQMGSVEFHESFESDCEAARRFSPILRAVYYRSMALAMPNKIDAARQLDCLELLNVYAQHIHGPPYQELMHAINGAFTHASTNSTNDFQARFASTEPAAKLDALCAEVQAVMSHPAPRNRAQYEAMQTRFAGMLQAAGGLDVARQFMALRIIDAHCTRIFVRGECSEQLIGSQLQDARKQIADMMENRLSEHLAQIHDALNESRAYALNAKLLSPAIKPAFFAPLLRIHNSTAQDAHTLVPLLSAEATLAASPSQRRDIEANLRIALQPLAASVGEKSADWQAALRPTMERALLELHPCAANPQRIGESLERIRNLDALCDNVSNHPQFTDGVRAQLVPLLQTTLAAYRPQLRERQYALARTSKSGLAEPTSAEAYANAGKEPAPDFSALCEKASYFSPVMQQPYYEALAKLIAHVTPDRLQFVHLLRLQTAAERSLGERMVSLLPVLRDVRATFSTATVLADLEASAREIAVTQTSTDMTDFLLNLCKRMLLVGKPGVTPPTDTSRLPGFEQERSAFVIDAYRAMLHRAALLLPHTPEDMRADFYVTLMRAEQDIIYRDERSTAKFPPEPIFSEITHRIIQATLPNADQARTKKAAIAITNAMLLSKNLQRAFDTYGKLTISAEMQKQGLRIYVPTDTQLTEIPA